MSTCRCKYPTGTANFQSLWSRHLTTEEKTGNPSSARPLSGKPYQVSDSLKIKRKSPVILKISVLDAHGIGSEPRFFVLPPKEIKRGWPPLFSCDQIGYPDFIELRIVSSDILSGLPSVTLLSKAKRLRIRQRDIRTYEAVIPFQIGQEGINTVCIEGTFS